MEEIVNMNADVVENDEKDQLKQIKENVIKLIQDADGFLVFAFKDGEIELGNGQKMKVPKSMIKESGAAGGGSLSLPYCVEKVKALLQMENDARNAHTARLSE